MVGKGQFFVLFRLEDMDEKRIDCYYHLPYSFLSPCGSSEYEHIIS